MTFLQMGMMDVIDILLGAILLYQTYKLMRKTQAYKLFIGVIIFILMWVVVSIVFRMRLLGEVMNQVMNFGVIALIILFQEEIRSFIGRIGEGRDSFLRIFRKNEENTIEDSDIMQIVVACKNMSREKCGALIVIEQGMGLQSITVTGDEVDAKINARLIENIFFKNSPLHDGAMVISKRRIKSAGCILPVSHSMELPKHMGLRHRAALGVSEKLDVKTIIVSEETGNISYAHNGEIKSVSVKELELLLSDKQDSVEN